MNFLKRVWRTITAMKNATTNIIFLVIVFLILIGLFTRQSIVVPESAALVIDPTGTIVEQKRAIPPLSRLLGDANNQPQESLLRHIERAIRHGQTDSRIKALVLNLDGLESASMSMLQELGNDIDEFKATGKPVYAFGYGYTQTQYYIAAHATKVYIDQHAMPAIGGVFLTGFGIYPTYLKQVLDKLKIQVHVFRVGKYKSAVEPYMRDDMSDDAKEESRTWLNVLWKNYVDDVATSRGLKPGDIDNYISQYDVLLGKAGNDPDKLAVSQHLVDALVTRADFADQMGSLVGGNKSGYHKIDYRDYNKVTTPAIRGIGSDKNKIAVITAKGTILDGEQPPGNIGAESLSKLIERARKDRSVKAIVLRVDSPGGSAAAAERIRAELGLAQKAGKPVVVSMSGYAASGGYWISASANKIYAMPTTVTGSIGTFMVFPTFENTLDSIGVHSDGVGTTALSNAMNPFMPINPILEHALQQTIDNTYSRFVNLVAKGRDLSPAEVEKIAQGRVWSGQAALKLGLVDALGSVQDAIKSAAALADVSEYQVVYLKQRLTPGQELLRKLANDGSEALASAGIDLTFGLGGLGRISEDVQTLLRMSKSPAIYVQCVTCNVKP